MTKLPENEESVLNSAPPVIPPKRHGLPRLIAAARYSFAGFRAAFASEEAFRLEVLCLIILTPVALYFGQTPVEKILLIGVVLLLMVIELLNTAVEAVVDRIGSEYHELSRQAKDIGSAAVFIGMVLVAMVWGLILL
jgi:diacylglycerol kinase (ATP)